jgi:hypothetical protein
MKKMLMLLLALALLGGVGAQVWAESRIIYSDGSSLDNEDDLRRYQYVRNTDQVAGAFDNGDVVIWDIRSATNTSLDNRWSVTTTTVAAHPLRAGVIAQAIDNGERGWMQTYGLHQDTDATGTISPETQLETSATRGTGRPASTTSNATYGTPVGYNGSGATETLDVFINTD